MNILAAIVLCLVALPAAHASDYERVNAHVAKVPEPVTRNSFALAKYLVEPFESENERTWAIFRWITTNINYDTEALLQLKKSYETADEILKHRRCVCIGYANLFKHMAAVAGLEAEVVFGYSKAYGYERWNLPNRFIFGPNISNMACDCWATSRASYSPTA